MNAARRPPGERWDPARVLARLRERQRRRLALDPYAVRREEPRLYDACRTHFGSYRAAAECLGWRRPPPAWNRARVLDELGHKARAGELGHSLSRARKDAAARYFCSLAHAPPAARLPGPPC